jgi:hypothetical protein
VVSAKVMARATARPVCEALLLALKTHGVPEQILTDTGRCSPDGSGRGGRSRRGCLTGSAGDGIRHLLTAPRSPTTTGKVERLHKTRRAEFFIDADGQYATIEELQQGLDEWVVHYNTQRPHQALGIRPPADRFALVSTGPGELEVVDPVPVPVPTQLEGQGRGGWRGYSAGSTAMGSPYWPRGQERVGLLPRDHVPCRAGVAPQGVGGFGRGLLGAAGLPGNHRAGPSDPPRPGQGTWCLCDPAWSSSARP